VVLFHAAMNLFFEKKKKRKGRQGGKRWVNEHGLARWVGMLWWWPAWRLGWLVGRPIQVHQCHFVIGWYDCWLNKGIWDWSCRYV
jgi:hypothetical protein